LTCLAMVASTSTAVSHAPGSQIAPIRLDWSAGEGASLSRLGYFGGAG
jgi:hypothetical protein